MGQVHLKIHNNFPDSNSSDEAKQWFAILNRISVFEGEVRGAQDQLEQLFDPADPGFSSATGRIKSELLGLQRGPLQGLVIQE